MKPTMGFKLPSAGVTPAPIDKKRCGTSSLFGSVWGGGCASESYLARNIVWTGEMVNT